MRLWRVGILGVIVGLALSGCDDPGPITPVAPPGANIPRTSPDADPAQAQGEMASPGPDTVTPPAAPPAKDETKTPKDIVK